MGAALTKPELGIDAQHIREEVARVEVPLSERVGAQERRRNRRCPDSVQKEKRQALGRERIFLKARSSKSCVREPWAHEAALWDFDQLPTAGSGMISRNS